MDEMLPYKAGQEARKLYAEDTLCCSEAVVAVINRMLDGGLNEAQAVALAKGFCGGIGDTGCVCGALAGAVIAQGLILGRGLEPADDKTVRRASRALRERFVNLHGSSCCNVLCKDRAPEDTTKGPCPDYVESATFLCAHLLTEPSAIGPADEQEDARARAEEMKRRRRKRSAARLKAVS